MSSQVHGYLDRQALVSELIRDESIRLRPYLDTANKITIGIGRNLTDEGITKDEALELLEHDIDGCIVRAQTAFPWWPALDGVRQRAILNMVFNLGIGGVLEFKVMLEAVADGDYGKAADEMLRSLWAHQVGSRANRLALMMRYGHV